MRLEAERWDERKGYKVSVLHRFDRSAFVQLVEINGRVGKHFHRRQTEVFVVVGGKGTLEIGEKMYRAECGDVFLCRPETIHSVEGNLKILVFKYGYEENDSYWLE